MSQPRRQLDQYFTPVRATAELLNHISIKGCYVLECCNGRGDISNLLKPECDVLWTNDIDRSLEADFHADMTDLGRRLVLPDLNWVISNPPFNQAAKIIPRVYNWANVGIAMLLRGSYTEPTFDRQHWLKEHEQHLAHIIYLPRISFTGDGKTDNVSCNWYVWTKEKVSGCQLHWVTKEKR